MCVNSSIPSELGGGGGGGMNDVWGARDDFDFERTKGMGGGGGGRGIPVESVSVAGVEDIDGGPCSFSE